ncbi:unnamed protein product [Camellia sinensis]
MTSLGVPLFHSKLHSLFIINFFFFSQICDRFINRRMAQKFYDKALTIGLKGYAQLYIYITLSSSPIFLFFYNYHKKKGGVTIGSMVKNLGLITLRLWVQVSGQPLCTLCQRLGVYPIFPLPNTLMCTNWALFFYQKKGGLITLNFRICVCFSMQLSYVLLLCISLSLFLYYHLLRF